MAFHFAHYLHCMFNHCITQPYYCTNTIQPNYFPEGVISFFFKHFGDDDELKEQVIPFKTKMKHLPKNKIQYEYRYEFTYISLRD